jgi:hypothetical protein
LTSARRAQSASISAGSGLTKGWSMAADPTDAAAAA